MKRFFLLLVCAFLVGTSVVNADVDGAARMPWAVASFIKRELRNQIPHYKDRHLSLEKRLSSSVESLRLTFDTDMLRLRAVTKEDKGLAEFFGSDELFDDCSASKKA